MKKGIHPEYKPTTIVCSCGNEIQTRSTQDEIHVEICAVCHPFYTGRQKLVDTAGRVERFNRKYGDVSSGAGEEEEEEAASGESSEAPAPAGDAESTSREKAPRQPRAVAAATPAEAGSSSEPASETEASDEGEADADESGEE